MPHFIILRETTVLKTWYVEAESLEVLEELGAQIYLESGTYLGDYERGIGDEQYFEFGTYEEAMTSPQAQVG